MMQEEKILCAAIHFNDNKKYSLQPINIGEGFVMCGFRHGCIFEQTSAKFMERKDLNIMQEIQGFLTNKNRFVSRKEAWVIAENANQIIDNSGGYGTLYSEDLY